MCDLFVFIFGPDVNSNKNKIILLQTDPIKGIIYVQHSLQKNVKDVVINLVLC